jgi:hypothetical protein
MGQARGLKAQAGPVTTSKSPIALSWGIADLLVVEAAPAAAAIG